MHSSMRPRSYPKIQAYLTDTPSNSTLCCEPCGDELAVVGFWEKWLPGVMGAEPKLMMWINQVDGGGTGGAIGSMEFHDFG